MSRYSDPLGLTEQQRVESNFYAAMRSQRVWWPREVDDRIIDGEWTENTTVAGIAESLHSIGAEVQLALEPLR